MKGEFVNIQEEKQLIYALATWRALRKKGKSLKDIVGLFCKNVVQKEYSGKHSFTCDEMVRDIERYYGLNILESVIKEILTKDEFKKLLNFNRERGCFEIIHITTADEEINKQITKYRSENDELMRELATYIQKENKKTFTEDVIFKSFYGYILQNQTLDFRSNNELLILFTKFLTQNNKFENLLRTIKEGQILYEGLKYKTENKKSNQEIILFLDTEILFHAMEYNGPLFKKRFDDFFALVKEYNRTKLSMRLFFSEMVEQEVEDFFYAAMKIKQNKGISNTKAAMHHLLNKCEDADEIKSEKNKFFHELEKLTIKKYEYSYQYLLNNYDKFNLESIEDIRKIQNDLRLNNKDIDVQKNVKALSFTSMVRRSNEVKYIFSSKAMFITDTGNTLKIAWNENIMSGKTIPLASSLEFIIARLWDFLEPYLDKKYALNSFNPLIDLQILLTKNIQMEIEEQYKKAEKNYNDNKDDELYKKEIIDIRQKQELDLTRLEDLETIQTILTESDLEETKKILDIQKAKEIGEAKKEERKRVILEIELDKQRKNKRTRLAIATRKSKMLYMKILRKIRHNIKRISFAIIGAIITIILGITTNIVERVILPY